MIEGIFACFHHSFFKQIPQIVALYFHCIFIPIHFFLSMDKRAMFISLIHLIWLCCVKSLVEKAFHCLIIIDMTTRCFSPSKALIATAAAAILQVISFVFKKDTPMWEIEETQVCMDRFFRLILSEN